MDKRTYDTHTCSRSFYCKQIFANWMVEKHVDQFRANIDYIAIELLAAVVRDAQV